MKLVKAMDAGPVYAQQTIPVPNKITKQELVNEVQKIGSKMIVQHLPGILSGALAPDVQDHSQASYDALLSAKDSVVDWSKSASVLEREIRAFAGWPKSTAQIGKQQVILHQVDVVKTSGNPGEFESTKKELVVYCGEDALKILRLQPLNKKEMPVEAFLAGYPL